MADFSDISRPPMYQTHTPFVEMYVNGVDILRSISGKPRTLVSFSHDIYAGTGGFWTLTVFDPAYIAMEELMVATGVKSTDVADKEYGESSGTTTDKSMNIATCVFRYGYVGGLDDTRVLSVAPTKEEFFYGTIHAFIPSYQTNGTMLVIRGDSAGTRIRAVPQEYTSYEGLNLYEIVQAVCREREWILVPYGMDTGDVSKDTDYNNVPDIAEIPIEMKTTSDGNTTTEEAQKPMRQRENEDPLNFLNRLCLLCRPKLPEGNNFTCRLEFRIEGKGDSETHRFNATGEPRGYLHFGLESFNNRDIVRSYTYMRDAKSDIISFQPNVQVWTAKLSGASGLVYKYDDVRTGKMGTHVLSEVSRSMKTDRGGRTPISFTFPEMAKFQEGLAEYLDAENKNEGSGSGSSRPSGQQEDHPDAPTTQITAPGNDERQIDKNVMNYYLAMQNFVTRADMTIFGDPSPEIAPGNVIAVWIYVPDLHSMEQDMVRIHWTSSVWLIVGVSHEIQGGEMTTNLELNRQGWNRGGITSKTAWTRLTNTLSEGAQRRLSGTSS